MGIRNIYYLCIATALSFVYNFRVYAQNTKANDSFESNVKQYCDFISTLRRQIYSDSIQDCNITPQLYKLLSPSIYYRKTINDCLKINDCDKLAGNTLPEKETDVFDGLLLNLYSSNVNLLTMHEDVLDGVEVVIPEEKKEQNAEQVFNGVFKSQENYADVDDVVDDVRIKVTRPNFWKTSCVFTSQFTQNYFSENWHKGGTNNTTMLTSLTFKANYNDQKRIIWENTLEMRLGFVTTTNDTCHNYLTNNDRLRLWSKLGVKAKKNWSYTTTFEATTQFLPSYRSNDRRTYADFMAPLDMYLSVGMDFRPSFKNGNTLSIALLPLSYKMRYIGSSDENIHNATNMKNQDKREDFGAKFELLSSVNILKNLTWNCRLTAFTSYEYTESELENKLRYKLTKYISSELYTLWRFDDNRPPHLYDDNLGYFQFREYLTFGLTYDF